MLVFEPKPAYSRWGLVFFLVGLLAGCGNTEQAQVLRVGTNIWPGYEPLYLARSLDYFDGESIHLVEYSSASQVSRAFRNNLIDAAALTLDEVMLLAQYNFEPEIILVMDVSNGGDVIMSRPEIKDMAALKGRKVGVESTALGAFLLARSLQIAGMEQSDVTMVPLEVDEHERAYRNGNVDAVVTFEPVRSHLQKLGARQIFDSSQMPGEIVDVLVVRRDYLETSPAPVRKLIDGWYQALHYMASRREDAMQRIAARLSLSPMETMQSYEGLDLPDKQENRRLLIGDRGGSARLPVSAVKQMEIMTEMKLLRRPVQVPELFKYVQTDASMHD